MRGEPGLDYSKIGRYPERFSGNELAKLKKLLIVDFILKKRRSQLNTLVSAGYDLNDVVQELYVRAEPVCKSYKSDRGNFSTFYYVILNTQLNKFVNFVFRGKRDFKKNVPLSEDHGDIEGYSTLDPEEHVEVRKIKKFIDDPQNPLNLTPDEKKVIEQVFFNDLTLAECAKLYSLTQAQIKRLKNAGLEKIRRYLSRGHKK